MSSTTSRWMSRSWLNASSSWVRFTAPSIEFSMATNPRSTSPALDGVEHVRHGREQHLLRGGEIGLAAQRLLGERAARAEEPDALGSGGGSHVLRLRGRSIGFAAIRRYRAATASPLDGGASVRFAARMDDVDETTLRTLLEDVRDGRVAPDDAVRALRRLPFADLGDARVDHHRRSAPGPAGGGLRPGQVTRAMRPHRRRTAGARQRAGAVDPGRRCADEGRALRPAGGGGAGEDDRLAVADDEPAGAGPRVQRRHG